MEKYKMIDVSQFNGVIDWEKVKPNVDMACIRLGYRGYGSSGTLVVDRQFKRNMDGAIKAGIPVGVYWFSQAVSEKEALEEAEFCRKLLAPYQLALPVALDSEHAAPDGKGRGDVISKVRRTQYGKVFLDEMRRCGYGTSLYCSEHWYTADIDGPAIQAAGHDIWIAKYSSVKPKVQDYQGWQYTSKGKVPGIPGYVDLNHVYKDYLGAGRTEGFKKAVQQRFGLDKTTVDYLAAYKYGDALLKKLATRG